MKFSLFLFAALGHAAGGPKGWENVDLRRNPGMRRPNSYGKETLVPGTYVANHNEKKNEWCMPLEYFWFSKGIYAFPVDGSGVRVCKLFDDFLKILGLT